jgi:dTDP-4-dehydrorhamnose reductase
MKVLIIGKNGQLGYELLKSLPEGIDCIGFGRDELDVTHPAEVQDFLTRFNPDTLINASAYTAVDKAESDRESCFAVNHFGAQNLAHTCSKLKTRLLHVSTDFVFDGNCSSPYQVDDLTNPLGVYGQSKLEGEKSVMQASVNNLVVRTSWVYSAHGNNFVKTMLKLMEDKEQLGVVYDQVGTPTWAAGLAEWLWGVVKKPEVKGVYHWTDAGVASWYDFAMAIQELAYNKGLLSRCIPVNPIPASSYPTPAKRPNYSVLDKSAAEEVSGIKTTHWRLQLSGMLDNLLDS